MFLQCFGNSRADVWAATVVREIVADLAVRCRAGRVLKHRVIARAIIAEADDVIATLDQARDDRAISCMSDLSTSLSVDWKAAPTLFRSDSPTVWFSKLPADPADKINLRSTLDRRREGGPRWCGCP
jgi:hypothetical protein